MTHSRLIAVAVLGASLSVGCADRRLYAVSQAPTHHRLKSSLDFVVLADTQYAEPYTDYDVVYKVGGQVVDLSPAITSKLGSFYRNAEAHFAAPLAIENILSREEKTKAFGMFGGDLVEFSCKNEAKTLFDVLAKHKSLPFIFTIGNHDALFHGSYDTDAIGLKGEGPWDRYSFQLWDHVCKQHGGPITKSSFIRGILDYYAVVWKFDFKAALNLRAEDDYPRGVPLSGTVRTDLGEGANRNTWALAFSFRLDDEGSPLSHRRSHLFQRFTHLPPAASKEAREGPDLTVTVLDTTDYANRRTLCQKAGEFFQVGMAGAVSLDQVQWLESLPAVIGPQLLLSHYMPVEAKYDDTDHRDIDECEVARGMRCLGARVDQALRPNEDSPEAIYLYGHVHLPYRSELSYRRPEKPKKVPKLFYRSDIHSHEGRPVETTVGPRYKLVRLPSLIDDKQYVVFENGVFGAKEILGNEQFASVAPFGDFSNSCRQRFREFKEMRRNVDCYVSGAKAGSPGCPLLEKTKDAVEGEGEQFCANLDAWKQAHLSEAEQKQAEACASWETDAWRCVLKQRTDSMFDDAKVPQAKRFELGEMLLRTALTKPESKPLPFPNREQPHQGTKQSADTWSGDGCF